MLEIVYIIGEGIINTFPWSEMGHLKNVIPLGITGIVLYLNGPPGVWREERHSTNFYSFHWEV